MSAAGAGGLDHNLAARGGGGGAGGGDLLGGGEADVAHALELVALLDQALGADLLVQQVVGAAVALRLATGLLNLDLYLLRLLGDVHTGVVVSLLLLPGVVLQTGPVVIHKMISISDNIIHLLLPRHVLSLPDSLWPRVEELVGDVQTHGPLPLPRVVPHPAVGEVVLPGRRGRGRGRRGAARGEEVARALAVLDTPADVLLLLLPQHHGGAVVYNLQHGEGLDINILIGVGDNCAILDFSQRH